LSNLLREFLGRLSSAHLDLDHGSASRLALQVVKGTVNVSTRSIAAVAQLKRAGRIVSDQQMPPRRAPTDIGIELLEAVPARTHRPARPDRQPSGKHGNSAFNCLSRRGELADLRCAFSAIC